MEIYVLRHGKAEDGVPGRPDSERALTPEGREKLRRVLKRASDAGAAPSLILTSPYVRAVETAGIARKTLGCQCDLLTAAGLAPMGSPEEVWAELRVHAGVPAVLLSTHEPLASAVVAYLLGTPSLRVDMKKAALVRIDCDRLGARPAGVLKWMLTPAVS